MSAIYNRRVVVTYKCTVFPVVPKESKVCSFPCFVVQCLCLSSDDKALASHSNRKRSPATHAESNAKHDPDKTQDAPQRQLEAVHNRETDYPILESCEKSDILQEALAGVSIFMTS